MPVLLLLPVRLLLLLLHVRLHVGSDALLQPILKVHFLHRLWPSAQADARRGCHALRLLSKVHTSAALQTRATPPRTHHHARRQTHKGQPPPPPIESLAPRAHALM
jgi:hypothetical protein